MIVLIVLGFSFLVLVLLDLAFPVLYRLKARKHKLAVPLIVSNPPFGIRETWTLARAASQSRLLDLISEIDNGLPVTTTIRQALFRWTFRTTDPENIKAMLSTKFNDFSVRRSHMRDVFGTGIFSQDGKGWKHSRTTLRPHFSKEHVSRVDSMNRHVEVLIDIIREHEQAGRAINMQHYFHLYTMDTSSEFLLGESVDSLTFGPDTRGPCVTDPVSGKSIHSADFVEAHDWLGKYAFYAFLSNSLYPLVRLFTLRARRERAVLQAFVSHYVRKALDATADQQFGESEKKDDSAGEYVFSHELAREIRDPIALRDQLLSILFAGRDTTASTLSFSMYYLAKYRAEFERLRSEVLEHVPKGTQFTYDSLRKLQYLQYFVKEVLRLAPTVPNNLRFADRDTMLPRGGGATGDEPVFVAKDMCVQYSVSSLHRDPKIYGADANEFRPMRWAPENRKADSPMYTWGYLPFNGGPRICLGQQFALTEISLTLAHLVREFDVIEPAEGFPEGPRPDDITLVLRVGGPGVPVRMRHL